MADVAVVVPARDAAATLPALLAALEELDCEVVVVDDGSSVPVQAPRVVRLEGVGPGAARNAGAAATRAPVLAFIDADCVPAPGWLAAGLAALEGADLVQGRVDPDPGAVRHPFDRTVSVPTDYGLFEAANLFVRRSLFERLGGFGTGIADPGKHLAEDVYFGWAAVRAGARVVFAPDALVHHAVFARDWRGFVGERARLRHFPEIVRAVPELRERFLWRRWFLNAQTARFDAALLGAAAAVGGGRGRAPRAAAALALAAPYALETRRRVRHWPGHKPLGLAAALVAADAVGAAALAWGSLRRRSPVL